MILRIVEQSGIAESLISLQFPVEFAIFIDSIHGVDCLERPLTISTLKWHSNTNELKFSLHRLEIKVFELQLK